LSEETIGHICEKKVRKQGREIKLSIRTLKGQITEEKIESSENHFSKIKKLPLESLIKINGDKIELISKSNISKKDYGDFNKGKIRDFIKDSNRKDRHILLRDPLYLSIHRIRNVLKKSIEDFFLKENVEWVPTSLLTKATEACEDISSLFWTEYQNDETGLDERVALAQTSQLHLEALAFCFGDVYTIAPSFRSEKGAPTKNHLLEYWHIEGEFLNKDYKDLMKFTENLVKYSIKKCMKKCKEEISHIKKEGNLTQDYIDRLLSSYSRMTYKEAIEKLQKGGYDIEWGDDFNLEAEKALSEEKPIFITDWPDELKAFYFTRYEENDRVLTKSFDLLGPGHGEIIGAGQRESNKEKFEKYIKRQKEIIKAHGHDPKDYKYYEDLREIGSVKHSGFGMGLERLLSFILNLDNVRIASLFPRDQRNLYP